MRYLPLLALMFAGTVLAKDLWVHYPGSGKHVVFVSGDEEYRSEEGLPQLAKILSQRHGFDCTVLFAIEPSTGEINPKQLGNIPGLEALALADLMVIQTRFRDLPQEQMKHIDEYLEAGKPVIGLRTATHAFQVKSGPYQHYTWNYAGPDKEWSQGFGRLVLGETWVAHHGAHKSESTRGIIAPGAQGSPLLNGISDGEVWGPTDVYEVRLPLPGDSKPILLGQVTKREGPAMTAEQDPLYGMRETDKEPVAGKKNNPMMPIAWTHSYQLPGGKPGKAFATTMGASTDLLNEGLRRLIVNAAYDLLDMPVPAKADVRLVGDYKPRAYGFDEFKKGMKPADFK
jgi:hypothetical protein